jgi:hypothetical protein
VLFTLIAERYEHRSIVVTSNVVFSQWDQIFQDPAGGITVHKGPEGRGYRFEGVAELTPGAHTPGRPEMAGRALSMVAGEGFDASRLASFARSPPTSGL